MGTPEFAVTTLKYIIEAKYNVVGIITAPDRPAGRGRKLQQSAVKEFAVSKDLPVLQPTNLKSSEFLKELEDLKEQWSVVNENGKIADRGTVLVSTLDGKLIHWEKQPNIKDGQSQKLKRLEQVIEEFKLKGVKVNRKNINEIGFGAKIFYEWRKLQK